MVKKNPNKEIKENKKTKEKAEKKQKSELERSIEKLISQVPLDNSEQKDSGSDFEQEKEERKNLLSSAEEFDSFADLQNLPFNRTRAPVLESSQANLAEEPLEEQMQKAKSNLSATEMTMPNYDQKISNYEAGNYSNKNYESIEQHEKEIIKDREMLVAQPSLMPSTKRLFSEETQQRNVNFGSWQRANEEGRFELTGDNERDYHSLLRIEKEKKRRGFDRV